VDPVDIWEGIDTQLDGGRNSIVKLAIHILSIIANSAGCERAFSHMGLVHTGIRSQLGVEKVRKTTMVGMDIKRSHSDAGLLRPRKSRNFDISDGDGGSNPTDTEIGEFEDVLEYADLARDLIASAAADVDSDSDDDDDLPITPVTIPAQGMARPTRHSTTANSQAIPAASAPAPARPPAQSRRTATGKITLENLFIYPTPGAPSNGIDLFWSGGIKNLETEMELHEILNAAQASDNIGVSQPDVQMAGT
jgi:hypothetical protein